MPTDLFEPTELHNLLDYQLFLAYRNCCLHTEATCRAEMGVGGRHWRILATVAENPGATLRDIAREADLDMAQTSRAVGQLVRIGLVRRGSKPSNSRQAEIQPTPRGAEVHQAMQRRLGELNAELLAALEPAQVHQLAAILDALNERARALIDEKAAGEHRSASS